jgi:3-hydroxyacyl-[acyl-carrier-protein] dehydratase
MPKDLILDFAEYDVNHVVADLEEIRKYNRQRFEMEQLTAVCYFSPETSTAVGYKDLSHDEFWVRGHMPGMPLMPGVITCEIAAQLSSFVAQKLHVLGRDVTIGFGGMNDVRFRGVVVPGQRIVVVVKQVKVRKGVLVVSQFQAFVERSMVAEGEVLGVALPSDAEINASSKKADSSRADSSRAASNSAASNSTAPNSAAAGAAPTG